ncbi:alpha/beta hydrolase [Marilutibacter spongiae]|uniref:Alpha/beta fold hydrolase n=1 Tax=Marilutibacter spongiae TaxID=2025720 RepID=A0A7W3Y7E1_9GAMM|nr:alpha/beta hydrolase [Lysobacter spongiae]MBB1061980.1 alpha/beta fold hydrolase [Lysobacter spongiae]
MRSTRLIPAAFAAAWLATACQPTPPAGVETDTSVERVGAIDFAPCVLGGEHGQPTVEAQCGHYEVAENPAAPEGRRIRLNIARLPAEGKSGGTEDPVFFLAGGPGQAATDVAAVVDNALKEVRKQRDIVLVDQRGTGASNPLDCRGTDGKPLEIDPADSVDPQAAEAYFAQCLRSLEGRADTRFYTTAHAIADLDAVRQAMEIEQVNLIGGSYGTRVAQQYAMHYPAHTRSVVLDGVAPNRLVVGGEFARMLDRALRLQDAQCAALPACESRFGHDLVARIRALQARLEATPVELNYRHPTTFETRQGTLTGDTVVGLVHGVSYVPQLSALLPLVVDEADAGRYEPLMSIAQLWSGQMEGMMNLGMQRSVVCAEDAPRYTPDPADAGTLMGAEQGRQFFSGCDAWPVGDVAADFTQPYSGDLPTLLLSGELDPVTPPEYADEVAKGLANARHFALKGQGHGVMGVGCMPRLIAQFIESTDPGALDASCLDSLDYVPPFTSYNGWEP